MWKEWKEQNSYYLQRWEQHDVSQLKKFKMKIAIAFMSIAKKWQVENGFVHVCVCVCCIINEYAFYT